MEHAKSSKQSDSLDVGTFSKSKAADEEVKKQIE
jgi:hypothetical protein